MSDYIVRATAANSQVRAFAAVTKKQWRQPGRLIIPVLWRRQLLEDCLLQGL